MFYKIFMKQRYKFIVKIKMYQIFFNRIKFNNKIKKSSNLFNLEFFYIEGKILNYDGIKKYIIDETKKIFYLIKKDTYDKIMKKIIILIIEITTLKIKNIELIKLIILVKKCFYKIRIKILNYMLEKKLLLYNEENFLSRLIGYKSDELKKIEENINKLIVNYEIFNIYLYNLIKIKMVENNFTLLRFKTIALMIIFVVDTCECRLQFLLNMSSYIFKIKDLIIKTKLDDNYKFILF